jgi:hypothetical protein
MSGSRREEAAEALRLQRKAAADEAEAREAAYQALPHIVEKKAALIQAAYDWAEHIGPEVTGTEVMSGFNELFAFFTARDSDLAEGFHLCLQGEEAYVYLHADPVRYANRHPAERIQCEAALGDALRRAESYKHRRHYHR